MSDPAIKVDISSELKPNVKQSADAAIAQIDRVTKASKDSADLRTRIEHERQQKAEEAARRQETFERRQQVAANDTTAATDKQAKALQHLTTVSKAVAVVSGAVAAGFLLTVHQAIKHAAAVQTLAERYSKTAEEMGALVYQARVADTSIEALTHSFDKLAMIQARGGLGRGRQGKEALDILGVDAKGKDAKTVLYEVADAFRAIEDAETKAALATMLFGERGREMVVYLSKGSDELRRLEGEGRRWAEVSGRAGEQTKALQDNMVTLGFASQEFAKSLLQDVVPAVNAMIERFLEARREGSGLFGAIAAGLRAGGSDMHKAQRELAEGVDRKLQIQRDLDRLLVRGDDGEMRPKPGYAKGTEKLRREMADIDAQIARARAYITVNAPAESPRKGPNKDDVAAQLFARQYRARDTQREEALEELERHRGKYSPEQYASLRKEIETRFKDRAAPRAATTDGWIQSMERSAARADKVNWSMADEVEERLAEPGKKYSSADQARARAAAAEVDAINQRKKATQAYIREMQEREQVEKEMAEYNARRQDAAVKGEIEAGLQLRQTRIAGIQDERTRRLELFAFEQEQAQRRLDLEDLTHEERARRQKLFDETYIERQKQLADDLKPAWQRMVDGWDNMLRTMEDGHSRMVEATVRAGEEMVVNWRRNGSLSGKGMADAFLDEFMRTMYRQSGMGKAVAGFANSAATSLLGAFTGGASDNGLSATWLGAPEFHTGRGPGERGPQRAVHPAYFEHAPRFHSGRIAPGEMPAIIRKDESVLTPGQMRAMGAPRVTIQIVNQSSAPVAATQQGAPRFDGEGYVVGIVLRDLTRGGPLRDQVQRIGQPVA